ncbi:MAG: hypothetical protein HYW45_03455 [Candidatus Daviesbacteria bacterium]|nr:MAG: hypothetical protein HYW45_03455 [Candidatus Daviesbacteria bacterium]
MDDPNNNNQGNDPVNSTPVDETNASTAPAGISTPFAAPLEDSAKTEEPKVVKCVKCSGDVADGNCATCTMPEGECNCPPAAPAETPA